MRAALSIAAQTILFLIVFLFGTLWDPFRLRWFVTHPAAGATRYFVPDGLLLALGLYLALVVVAGLRRRLATSGVRSTAAMVLALVLGLLSKFGFAGS